MKQLKLTKCISRIHSLIEISKRNYWSKLSEYLIVNREINSENKYFISSFKLEHFFLEFI